jgi:hypothetical protein
MIKTVIFVHQSTPLKEMKTKNNNEMKTRFIYCNISTILNNQRKRKELIIYILFLF